MSEPISRPLLSLATFSNALRVLHGIDLHECQEAGLFQDETRWPAFRDNPAAFFIRADDDTQAKLWTIVQRRTAPPPGQMNRENVAHLVRTDVDALDMVTITMSDSAGGVLSQITISGTAFLDITSATMAVLRAAAEKRTHQLNGVKPQ